MKALASLTAVFGILSIAGCNLERPTRVTVEGNSRPIFALSGSGNLSAFSVYVVSPSDLAIGRTVDSLSLDSFFAQPAVWRIQAQADTFHAGSVESISRLTYGVVPRGYKQSIPADGSAPPPILREKQYFFDCDTINAPGARGSFQRIDNEFVRSQISLPCLQTRSGKEVTVPCAVQK